MPLPVGLHGGMQRILDADDRSPAFVPHGRLDLLAANRLDYTLYSTHLEPSGPGNSARLVFLDPRSKDFYVD
jgi:hypothetical protein